MTRLAVMLAVAVFSYAVDVWAADIIPTKAPPATVELAPALCTDAWNFIASKCQLAWQGITVFGTITRAPAGRATARRLTHYRLSPPHT